MHTPLRLSALSLRMRTLRALGIPVAAAASVGACAAADREVVVAPIATPKVDAGSDAAVADGDGGTGEGGARRPTRAMREPPEKANCKRMVRCRAPDDEAQALPYPEPFERCAPYLSKSERETPFSPNETKKARVSEEGVCCYVEFRECKRTVQIMEGRALRTTGQLRRPTTIIVPTAASAQRLPRLPRIPEDAAEAQRLAARWSQAAENEHASVATFARISLELLALGAPADLVMRCQQASMDEVRHAADAYALASAYAGHALGPAPFAEACAPLVPDMVRLARETLLDGCIGESAAALAATEEAAHTEDPAVKAVLTRVARDESRHAELAFRMLAWLLSAGGTAVRDAIAEDLNALSSSVSYAPGVSSLSVHTVTAPIVTSLLASAA
jgi:hypothetical protein